MLFNKKSNKALTTFTKLVAVFMSAVIFSLLTGAVVDVQTKRVTLVMIDAFADSEKTQELTTRQNYVSEFLEENDITVGEYDRVSMLMEDELYSGARIIIRKGRKFTLNIDGNIEIITTTKKTVREAFEEAGISINQTDRVEPDADSIIEPDMNVSVYRVQSQVITVDTEIPFESREVSDSTLEKGKTRIKTKGVNGLKRTTYEVTTENGIEVKRVVLSESTVKNPTAQVVAVGTKPKSAKKTVTTNAGKSLSYSKKLTVTATAYTASSGSKTASGRVAQYGVIAVDPKVIPLGTKLYVESTDDGKTWKYGYCVAGDTGGAIKGNKIDLYYNSEKECVQFGRRSAVVYVLN
ncbi:MAG: 3D domain-containing protein [Clostridiales bacterium]|nr:3D domain-containing protein [Clostridiales bacterium]